ncbi:hypothetical protein GALL_514010 [mine drainage metagenome]|uniref:Uncharacterized protein n=1 Tax=mine drainage metagenome TaxID=410659 RepID=A0A1J5P741_9ZZZZ
MQVGPPAAKPDFCKDAVGHGHQREYAQRTQQVFKNVTLVGSRRYLINLTDQLWDRQCSSTALKFIAGNNIDGRVGVHIAFSFARY